MSSVEEVNSIIEEVNSTIEEVNSTIEEVNFITEPITSNTQQLTSTSVNGINNYQQFETREQVINFLRLMPDPIIINILNKINLNKSFDEIINCYLECTGWDGNYAASTTCGLFDAYLLFKKNMLLKSEDADYLSGRGGIFAIHPDNNVILSTHQFMNVMVEDMNDFDDWLASQVSVKHQAYWSSYYYPV